MAYTGTPILPSVRTMARPPCRNTFSTTTGVINSDISETLSRAPFVEKLLYHFAAVQCVHSVEVVYVADDEIQIAELSAVSQIGLAFAAPPGIGRQPSPACDPA